MARTTGLAEACNLTAVTMGTLGSGSPAQGTAARPVFTKAAGPPSVTPRRDAILRALCSTNRCESMKSKVTYPPKVDEKLSIGLFGESGERRPVPRLTKSGVWADPKDAGDAALGRRPRPEQALNWRCVCTRCRSSRRGAPLQPRSVAGVDRPAQRLESAATRQPSWSRGGSRKCCAWSTILRIHEHTCGAEDGSRVKPDSIDFFHSEIVMHM